jgi:hypothetical protein
MLTEKTRAADVEVGRPSNKPPPLSLMTLVIWVLLSAVLLARYGGDTANLQLTDPDDYLRLVQTTQWLDGADWYDVSQPRMNPPRGVDMHWSRLPDLPIAMVISVTEPAVGRQAATIIAAIVTPLVLLLAMLFVSGWMARPIIGRINSAHAVIIAALLPSLVVNFAPGRVDHHGWQLIAAGIGFGSILRIVVLPRDRLAPIIGGIAFAIGVWIGGEIVPWLFVYCLALSLVWVFRGGEILRAAFRFACSLLLTTVLLLPASNPPSRWFAAACDEFSLFHVVVACAVLAFWVGIKLVMRPGAVLHHRAVAASLLGVSIAGVLVALYPECLRGPYSNVNAELAAVWLSNIAEIKSLFDYASERPVEVPFWVVAPTIGVLISIWRAAATNGRARIQWLVVLLFALSGLSLCFYQIRFIGVAQLFALVPLAWFITWIWRLADRRWTGLLRQAMIFGPLLLLSPAPGYVVAKFAGAESVDGSSSACDIEMVSGALNELSERQLIAGFFNPGAELLFRTQHSVLAANYHRNADGNLAAYRLLSASTDGEAQSIMDEYGIDLILICPASPEMQFYKDQSADTFAERITDGRYSPRLNQLPIPDGTGYLLFEIVY